ncbi:amidase domain-containing protein [Enterococcus sp. BWB1-3]|uniref:amidase domain-containing protein n=1 Tax=unclassified Enterococcus TaxID=2608891 RepID=UPI0019224F2C|nr:MULTISPECIES: amidase domain-containing protein [unclassified Enterococcus]MBL1230194.1 amidase domain-containing protein [Enterococcus sp. BWB1-3]MCB5953763.1 amidase domain-containing protein [Enterococcus sp. CWB-B31]
MKISKLKVALVMITIPFVLSVKASAEESTIAGNEGSSLGQVIMQNERKRSVSDFDLSSKLIDSETKLLVAAKEQLGKTFEDKFSSEYFNFLNEVANTDKIKIGSSESENIEFNEFASIYTNRIGSITPITEIETSTLDMFNARTSLLNKTYNEIKEENRASILAAENAGSSRIQSRTGFGVYSATTYAKKHAKSYNTNYRAFPSDCTNFVSQIANAGGKSQSYYQNASGMTWYYVNALSYSPTWTLAHQFFVYWTASGASTSQYTTKTSAQQGMTEGTFVAYWKKNTYEITHASYVSQKSGTKAYITQHTTDRLNEAWDGLDVSAYSSFILLKF